MNYLSNMDWLVLTTGGDVYAYDIPDFVTKAGMDDDVRFFLALSGLFRVRGKLFKNDHAILFEVQSAKSNITAITVGVIANTLLSTFERPTDLQPVLGFKADMFEFLHNIAIWHWFEAKM